MIYLLDTSVLIDFLRKKPQTGDFIFSHSQDALISSTICEAELYAGVYREKKEKIELRKKEVNSLMSSLHEVIIFDSEQADIAGGIKAYLMERGELIEDMDILIAAAALSRNAILLTGNPRHFNRIKNLLVKTL